MEGIGGVEGLERDWAVLNDLSRVILPECGQLWFTKLVRCILHRQVSIILNLNQNRITVVGFLILTLRYSLLPRS